MGNIFLAILRKRRSSVIIYLSWKESIFAASHSCLAARSAAICCSIYDHERVGGVEWSGVEWSGVEWRRKEGSNV
jgi:hypothetical protein